MQKNNSVYRSRDADSLRAACRQEGCPVCTVILEAVEHYMDAWQYEGFTDVEHRHTLIQSRGFCPLHTWQLARRNNAFQLAMIYREVLTDVLDGLNQEYSRLDDRKSRLYMWRRRRPGRTETASVELAQAHKQCPICRMRTELEQRLMVTLLTLLSSEEMRALLSQSTGLCLLHFAQAHEMADAGQLRYLLGCQQACMQRTLRQIEELIRKHDYRFGNEARGDEMLSWRRAAELCAGNQGVR